MNIEAEWFRERMIHCANEHKRVRKTWTRMIWLGWALIGLILMLSAGFIAFRQWGSLAFQVVALVFMSFRLKDAYDHRKELCEQWLQQRHLYQQEYDKRK